MKTKCIKEIIRSFAFSMLAVFTFNVESRITASTLVCGDLSTQIASKTAFKKIDNLIVESKHLGKIIGVTISIETTNQDLYLVQKKLKGQGNKLHKEMKKKLPHSFDHSLIITMPATISAPCEKFRQATVVEFIFAEQLK
jgi:hypothetical protein